MQSNSDNSSNTSKPTSRTKITHTILELEARALTVLGKAFPNGIAIPVDIEWIAESHLGLEIVPIQGLTDSCEVFGAFRKRPDGQFDLVVDEGIMDRQENLYRFTVGEEIAHYILHRQHFASAETVEEVCGVYASLLEHHAGLDRNARWFASALLMPTGNIKSSAATNYQQMVHIAGFGDLGAIISALTGVMAKEFLVSREAMKYRLQNFPCKVYGAVQTAMAEKRPNLW